MRFRHFALLAVLAGSSASNWATTISPSPTLPVTTHGQTVTIYGDGFPNAPIKVYLRTGNEGKNDLGFPIDGTASQDGKNVTFKVKNDAPAGDFLVVLGIGGQEFPVPGELRITPDTAANVTLDSISPATDYLGKESNAFDFVMSGQNFAANASDNTVIEVGYGPLSAGTASECADRLAMESHRKICLSYDPGMERQKLNVMNYHPRHYQGPVSFEIQVGNNVSSAQKITFSRMRAETLRWVAIVVFFGLMGIVLLLVRKGIKNAMLAGENNKVLEAFFLDRQSNSFSLSKFQVIAWTTVAVFGYLYLYLCRTYIQWTFSFPPIPDGLPTLLGVSAGTTVTATAITVNRGSKGAGPMSPSMADFVSTGGLVAGERFQFFVWTLIGCLGFLGIVLSSDPASLTQLPDIQGTFLTLMGVSATGYLAGKLVRQPGPIIDLLTLKEPATPAVPATATTPMHPGIMKIKVKGQNLSDTAVVKVDQTELRIDQFTLTGTTKQDQPAGSSFYSELELDLLDAEAYRKGTHLIYLVNGDGQAACEAFPMNALTIDPVPAIKAGSAPVTVHLTGRNIAAGLVAGWVDAGHNTSPIPSTDIAFVDGNHFDVKLVPGPTQGTGALTLTTPSNLIVEAAIQIS